MATYIAIDTLMQDLEQYLTSYDNIFGGICPFTKKEIENLYNTVSLMDSFLRDSSGLSYNHEFVNPTLENRIRDMARQAGDYVDYWAVRSFAVSKFVKENSFEDSFLSRITKKVGCVDEKINDDDKDVEDLEDIASTANSMALLSPFRRTTNTGGKLAVQQSALP